MDDVQEQFDRITVEQLRSRLSEKWTTFPDCYGAFVAEMDFGLAPALERALADAIRAGMTGYPSLPLIAEASKTTAAYLASAHDWHVPAGHIRPVLDVVEAYRLALELFSPSARVIIPTPAYPPLLQVATSTGHDIEQIPMILADARWELPLEDIERSLRDEPAFVVLCNPHNPTGAVMRHEQLAELSRIVEQSGSRVFSDEIHAPLVYASQRHIPYASVTKDAAAHTVTAISVSKGWNVAGLKFAQLVFTRESDLNIWRGDAPRAELEPGTLGAIATITALREGKDWLEHVLRYLDRNRQSVTASVLATLGHDSFVTPEATYFAWINCSSRVIDGDAARFLREHARLACNDGSAFGDGYEGFVRLNFATPYPVLQQMLHNFNQALTH